MSITSKKFKYRFNKKRGKQTMNSQYVLLTAAKDEEACITEVIELVLRQTLRPLAWIIIDDGSTDQTAKIIEQFALDFPFIQLHSAGTRGGRNFGSQYKALQAAYELTKCLGFEFEFVAVQDADQAPEQVDYYELIIGEFHRNPLLGMASGFVYERPQGEWECRQGNSEDSTAGSTMFRRVCFEQIGGYLPLQYGGSDWLAQLDAKILGWQILVRTDLHILHYRPTSSAGGIWRGKFREGLMDASFGSNPIFEFFKCSRRVVDDPFLICSFLRFGGYLWWNMTGRKSVIPAEKVHFLRIEQLTKLRRTISNFGFDRL
jgi:glycosyltransferase involved in cell wall biosynthesis